MPITETGVAVGLTSSLRILSWTREADGAADTTIRIVRQPVNPAPSGYEGVESTYGFVEFDFAAVLGGGGAYNLIGGNGPNILATNATNFAANVTWIRGKHQLRFGYEQHIPEWTQGLTKGGSFGGAQFQFSPNETSDPQNASSTGNPVASALMGIPDSGRFQSESNAFRVIMPAAYIQDTWKVTPRLTISAGFRWDGESSPHLEKGNAANLNPDTGNWEIAARAREGWTTAPTLRCGQRNLRSVPPVFHPGK